MGATPLYLLGSLGLHGLILWVLLTCINSYRSVPRIDVDLTFMNIQSQSPGSGAKHEIKKAKSDLPRVSTFSFSQNVNAPTVLEANEEDSSGNSNGLSQDQNANENISQIPKLIREVKAAYPEQARAEGREGQVVFLLKINEKGMVVANKILQAAGYGFDEAASVAIKQFVFSPAKRGDLSAEVEITYTYVFRLK